ncbi:Protection of telomeres protein 1b [Zea mays]|uniref:Protection of telomeres protein 1b n=1 Tax=Zea mays TaxID=4577 RepID=A0A1D6JHY5_MAIZE|nr:Protection of telomeres protein 1b [Zea mays]
MEEDSSAMEPNRLREAEAAAGELKRLREAGQSQYMYRSIADARVVGGRVCLFAVVSEIGATVHSRGTGLKDFTSNNSELYLMNLKSDSTFDLVCKVFHVHVENNNSIFYVWDGTDTPAAEFPAMMYDSRIANRVRRRPMASIPSSVTGIEHSLNVTHKLRTLVRVVAAHPCEASLLSTGNCHLRLTLEDPTARIHAYVHKNDLVGFFGGGFLTAEVIVKKMNMVLGIPEPQGSVEVAPSTRNPPWIWCCLMSYYMDKNDPWVSRKYRIYSTAIRD